MRYQLPCLDPNGSAIIDFVEAAYDLQVDAQDWLPALMRVGAPVLDQGLGVFAVTGMRPLERGPLRLDQVHLGSAPADLGSRVMRLQGEVDMSLLWSLSRPGMPRTLSEAARDHDPGVFHQILHYFDFAQDALGMSAFECSGHGIYLVMPLAGVTSLSACSQERWQMLAAHFGAGYRLRRALSSFAKMEGSALPYGAEALIEPTRFVVTDAAGPAKSRTALAVLREAALAVDRARGRMRNTDPQEALELWRALVRGRWSTVDWFDSDGRRFVLAMPNAPEVCDPRGLTEREHQVAGYAAMGQTNKMIGYRLGLSKGRVSALLSSAMQKLRAPNRAELIRRFLDFGGEAKPAERPMDAIQTVSDEP